MDKSEVSLELMRVFRRIVESGSLSAVARELGRGQSSVSRQLSTLEASLGVRLLARTTRSLSLTAEGAAFYRKSTEILDLFDRSMEDFGTRRAAVSGKVRITATESFGILHLSRLIFAFQDAHPEIDIDLQLNDTRVDLIREGVDLALRLGTLTDSSLQVHALGVSQRILVAPAAFLPRPPLTLADLAGQPFIRMMNLSGQDTVRDQRVGAQPQEISVGGSLRVDHGLAVREALRAGRGLAVAHRWLVDDLIKSGDVVQILPDVELASLPLSLLIVPGRGTIERVRLLIDYLAREIPKVTGLG